MCAQPGPLLLALPSWHKRPHGAAVTGVPRQDLAHADDRPIFLREVAQWDLPRQRMLFQILVPIGLLTRYEIDPIKLTDPQGRSVAFVRAGAEVGSYRLELYHAGDSTEPMAELELGDTLFNQIEVLWVTLQDPHGPRYDTDVLPSGASTIYGTAQRNVPAEEAAMAAGLAPGQVRPGLRSFRRLTERIEVFMLCLNQREFIARPLYYHTAILFEQYGFSYIQGQARMEAVARGFAPGGELRDRLDGSTPFHQPELADTIRGRSWAIHAGILPEPLERVQMVKHLGVHAGVSTSGRTPW